MINYLYKITNKVNGKVYIGITRDPDSRRKQHLVWKRQSSNSILKLAVEKYGKDAFEFEILVAGDLSYIKDLEIKAILAYDSLAGVGHGYNIHSGGGHNNGGEQIKYRSDDKPVCAFGFWFPNARTAIKSLGINKKTLYARRAEGILHLEARPLKATERPERGSEEDIANRPDSMKGKNSGELNGMFGRRNTARSRSVLIENILYESITDAVRQTNYTKSQIEKRLSKGIEGFSYA